jgi:hypothetical protein
MARRPRPQPTSRIRSPDLIPAGSTMGYELLHYVVGSTVALSAAQCDTARNPGETGGDLLTHPQTQGVGPPVWSRPSRLGESLYRRRESAGTREHAGASITRAERRALPYLLRALLNGERGRGSDRSKSVRTSAPRSR